MVGQSAIDSYPHQVHTPRSRFQRDIYYLLAPVHEGRYPVKTRGEKRQRSGHEDRWLFLPDAVWVAGCIKYTYYMYRAQCDIDLVGAGYIAATRIG